MPKTRSEPWTANPLCIDDNAPSVAPPDRPTAHKEFGEFCQTISTLKRYTLSKRKCERNAKMREVGAESILKNRTGTCIKHSEHNIQVLMVNIKRNMAMKV